MGVEDGAQHCCGVGRRCLQAGEHSEEIWWVRGESFYTSSCMTPVRQAITRHLRIDCMLLTTYSHSKMSFPSINFGPNSIIPCLFVNFNQTSDSGNSSDGPQVSPDDFI